MKYACPRFVRGSIGEARQVYGSLRSERSIERLRYSLLGAVVFCMMAHAFAYFNFAPVHDGVNYVGHLAGKWEVSIGRFLQPVYGELRGEYTMPWLSGMLSMLYIGLAAFLVNDLFEVENRGLMLLTAGFLSANATMTNLTMVFSYAADVFALALLLACAGAYAVIRMPNLLGILLSGGLLAVSMGLYQSYALVGGLLLVLEAMLQAACDRRAFAHQARRWLCEAAAVAVTVVFYLAAYRLFLHRYGTQMAAASAYNSPARLATLDVKALLPKMHEAYASFAEYFFGAGCARRTLMQKGDIALFALGGAVFAVHAVKERLPVRNLLLIAAGLLLFPGAAQVASILTQHGKIHFLTAHALFLMYPALLALLERIGPAAGDGRSLFARSGMLRACVMALCALILFGNIRYSNEMYTFRSVQYDKTVSYVTRLVERITTVPGYERGKTEVVFTGYSSAGLVNLEEPDGWEWMEGMNNSAITYVQVLSSFIRMMGEPMNIPLYDSSLPDYAAMDEVKAMPAFPAPDCCRMVDGRLLVKLTDN